MGDLGEWHLVSIAQFANASHSLRQGDAFEMVAGLTQTQNTGFDNGDGVVNQIGSILPVNYKGQNIHRVRRDNSGLNVTLFQTSAGDLGATFWKSILFAGPGVWDGFEVFAADGSFADNNGSASWNGMPDPGAFINGGTYQLEWFEF